MTCNLPMGMSCSTPSCGGCECWTPSEATSRKVPKIDASPMAMKAAVAPKGCKRCYAVKDKNLTPTKCLKVLKLAMEELEQGRGDTYGLFWTFEGNKLCAIDADTGKTVAKFAITATRIPPAFWRGPLRSK